MWWAVGKSREKPGRVRGGVSDIKSHHTAIMRIACLQLASRVGEVTENTKKADAMLDGADPDELRDLDLLVLPELALTGNLSMSRGPFGVGQD